MKTNESDLVERNENPVALNTIDAEKLLATPLPPMKYYVDGILPQGLSILAGSPKAGKSWLACALAQYACRQGHSALYLRIPRLAEELRIRHANGTFTTWLDTLKSTDVLLLDDWGMVGMDAHTRSDLLEIIDDRAGRKATIITSQLPIEHWHEWIGEATVADAMLDRIMQSHHRLTLAGESLRKSKPQPEQEDIGA